MQNLFNENLRTYDAWKTIQNMTFNYNIYIYTVLVYKVIFFYTLHECWAFVLVLLFFSSFFHIFIFSLSISCLHILSSLIILFSMSLNDNFLNDYIYNFISSYSSSLLSCVSCYLVEGNTSTTKIESFHDRFAYHKYHKIWLVQIYPQYGHIYPAQLMIILFPFV